MNLYCINYNYKDISVVNKEKTCKAGKEKKSLKQLFEINTKHFKKYKNNDLIIFI
jgi:hypothetical protein